MLRETIEGAEIYPISAATGQGIDRLLDAVTNALASLPQSEPFAEEELLPDALAGRSGYEVTVEDGVFVVSGRGAEQLVASVKAGHKFTTLLGATGTGKTFTMASAIARIGAMWRSAAIDSWVNVLVAPMSLTRQMPGMMSPTPPLALAS